MFWNLTRSCPKVFQLYLKFSQHTVYSFHQYSILNFTVLSGIRFLTAGAYKKPQSLARNRKECLQKSFNRRKVKVKNEEVYTFLCYSHLYFHLSCYPTKEKAGKQKKIRESINLHSGREDKNWFLIFFYWFHPEIVANSNALFSLNDVLSKSIKGNSAGYFCFDNLIM